MVTDSSKGIYIIADGWSGANPESAKTAVDTLYELLSTTIRKSKKAGFQTRFDYERWVPSCLEETNRSLIQKGEDERWSMKTTLDLVMFTPFYMYGWHIGDSMVYGIKHKERPVKLTIEHSKTARMMDDGRISPEYGRFIRDSPSISQAPESYLGEEQVTIQDYAGVIDNYRRFIMMTDGLSDIMVTSELEDMMMGKPNAALDKMAAAYKNGGSLKEFLKYSPRILDWTLDGTIFRHTDAKAKEKIATLLRRMDLETHPDVKQKAVLDLMNDRSVYRAYERAAKEFQTGRDNWSVILIENRR